MKSYHYEKKWIWESEEFPNFNFTKPKLEELFYKLGQLQTVEKFMNDSDSKELLLDVLEDEAVATSAIEGEILQRSSVRSSINKILRLGFDDDYSYTNQTDSLVEIIIDAKQNSDEPLSKDRLMTWHKALFPTGQSGFKKIQVGSYRADADEMQIVSGSWEKEKVHFVAPPSSMMDKMMSEYLVWLNEEVDASEIVYKAGVAHLWFLLIHPFDDGNGRIARAISDYVLSKSNLVNANFYSVATTIHAHRKEYYQILDKVCVRDDLDISLWMEWFVELLTESVEQTLVKVQTVKIKAMFWDKHINTKLNDRQKKVILKMLASLPQEFEGGMKVSKYISLTKATRLTSSRDLSDLVEKGVMQSHGSGRGVFYTLVF
jgi:Fic family protein